MVERPYARDDEAGAPQLVALFVEATILLRLAYKAFDLTNPGKIVVQERIHGRGCAAVQSVSAVRRERVPKRAGGQERHGRQRDQRQFCAEVKHSRHHHHDLQYRHGAFLDAADEDLLDRTHVLQNARHQIAGGTIIEPAQWQRLNVRIQISAQIENDLLLEGVIEQEAEIVQASLNQQRESHDNKQREQTLGMMIVDDIVKSIFRRRRGNDHHDRADDRASQRSDREHRIAFYISKDAPNRFHFRWRLNDVGIHYLFSKFAPIKRASVRVNRGAGEFYVRESLR